MPLISYPPVPTFELYDPFGTPVQFEMVPRDGNGIAQPFSVSLLSGLVQGWYALGIYNAPDGVTWPTYTPPGPLGETLPDGITFVAFAGALILHIDSVTATENQDGTGRSFDLVENARLFVGGPNRPDGTIPNDEIPTDGVHFDSAGVGYVVNYDIPDPPVLYVQSIIMTGYRQYELLSSSRPPPTPPPTVTGGNNANEANPGFTAEVHRDQDYGDDLVEVFLGDRVNLTVESEGARLGFHDRGHIITIVEIDLRSELQQGVKVELIDFTYTLEKIPGTLLPGAGTSTPEQDALGTGAEINLFAVISDDIPTIGVSGLA